MLIRLLVVGYVFAIRSERQICREVQVNLAYRWFCKLGIEDAIPDHSAFSRARNERFREGDVFRHVFERIVEACIAAGLVGGEGFAVDARGLLIPRSSRCCWIEVGQSDLVLMTGAGFANCLKKGKRLKVRRFTCSSSARLTGV